MTANSRHCEQRSPIAGALGHYGWLSTHRKRPTSTVLERRTGQMPLVKGAWLALLLLITASLSGCSRAPALTPNDGAMYEALTGTSGQEFLRRVSEHRWDDGGVYIAQRLMWIRESATSPDATAAMRAGQAAEAVATFLAESRGDLSKISTAWFGLEDRSVGQLNPELVRAYGAVLIPYQGAVVGDSYGVRGFDDRHVSGEARNVVAVLDTDSEAGNAFKDAAYERVHQYLRTYARAVNSSQTADLVTIRYAAELAGAVSGGQQLSGNGALEARRGKYWINWALYEIAAANGARPGDPDIPLRFFSADGRLLSPDQLANEDLEAFSTAAENYAFQHGAPTVGNDFDRWFDDAAGK